MVWLQGKKMIVIAIYHYHHQFVKNNIILEREKNYNNTTISLVDDESEPNVLCTYTEQVQLKNNAPEALK